MTSGRTVTIMAIIAGLLLLGISFDLLGKSASTSVNHSQSNLQSSGQSQKSSGSSKQRLVFIDLGANRGDSYEAMLGVGKKFNYNYTIPAGRSHKEMEAHLFEANSVFDEPLKEIKAKYDKDGSYAPIYIYPSTVVYTKDTTVSFFVDHKNPAHDFWGSSLLASHPDVTAQDKVDLPAVNIARFILQNFKKEDHVVVKVDIEGAEFDTIPHLLSTGAYVNIDYLYIEWHEGVLSEEDRKVKPAKAYEALKEMVKEGVQAPTYDSAAR
ncbi:hypothetical protein HDU79_005998 [Rhizoclosmatium sp. JEL0117]|nr:hypothetical protein HDU79_005998 [Rhizoclosmatium sp. JEL0117]